MITHLDGSLGRAAAWTDQMLSACLMIKPSSNIPCSECESRVLVLVSVIVCEANIPPLQ